MARPDAAFAILVSAFVLLWLGAGLTVLGYPMLVIRAPILAGLFTVAMCLTIAFKDFKAEVTSSRPLASGVRFDRGRLVRILGLTSILPIAYLLGYGVGLPVFLSIHLATNGLSWPRCLLAAAVCALLIQIVFVRILGIALPQLFGS